jgi:hypothetical protein
MLFGIWRVLKGLRLINGKATFFSLQDGHISIVRILEDLKDISAAGKLVDEAHQGMIIP